MQTVKKIGILLFMMWLSSGVLGLFVGIDIKKFTTQEMRTPVTIKEIKTYTTTHNFLKDIEAFISDRVFYRNQYISLYQALDIETISSQFTSGASLKGKNL